MIDSWIKFVKAHETLLIVLPIIAGLLFCINKYENYAHDEAVGKNAVAQQQLQDQITKNQELAAQSAASQQAYAKLAAQVSTQNALIATQIAALKQKTEQQQQIDATLPLAELAKRWAGLISMAEPEIQAVGENVSISGQAAHKTVEQLEMVEPLHNEVLAGHKIEDNLTAQLNSCNAVNKAQADQITGMASQIQKADVACQKEISVIKSNARKSKFKYLIGGIVGGILMALKFGI